METNLKKKKCFAKEKHQEADFLLQKKNEGRSQIRAGLYKTNFVDEENPPLQGFSK